MAQDKTSRKPGWSPTAPVSPTTEEAAGAERIAKVLARAGVCSRRDGEKLVAEGRVRVNGRVVATPAEKVLPGDLITVDEATVAKPEATRLWRYHKPPGLVTTHKDPEERPTVFANLPAGMPRVVSVGRLDFNSEGLILLTNDGALSRHLELPSTQWTRRYRVRLFGNVTQADLDRLAKGVTIDGVSYGPVEAQLERAKGSYAWAMITLREGKNREIKRLMEWLGFRVARLIRISYGPFQLGQLEAGEVEEVPGKVLREQLGLGGKPQPRPQPKSQAKAKQGA